MKTIHFNATYLAAAVLAMLALAQPSWAAPRRFAEARLIIEYNASAQDVGVQFFLDGEGWRSVTIFDPAGERIYSNTTSGSLLDQGGGTELFMESVEPPLSEVPFSEFFDTFPEGTYKFTGLTADGVSLSNKVTFTHDIPQGPVIVSPTPVLGGCSAGVSIPAIIDWNPVTTDINGAPIDIAGYEVIVENDITFDVHVPADVTRMTISPEVLEPGTHYIFEVLAIETGGNQTITEGCFTTAP